MLNRREFLAVSGTTLAGAAMAGRSLGDPPAAAVTDNLSDVSWRRSSDGGLLEGVLWKGRPLALAQGVGVLDGFCRAPADGSEASEIALGGKRSEAAQGPVQLRIAHRLHCSRGGGPEDLLEATLLLKNTSDRPHEVLAGFLCGVRPCQAAADQRVYVPFSARRLDQPAAAGQAAPGDCQQAVGREGFLAYYLEPPGGGPPPAGSRPPLLAPVVDVFAEGGPCRLALVGRSDQPLLFEALQGPSAEAWRLARRVRLAPGGEETLRAYLYLHEGDATEAWDVFHRFGHHEDFPLIEWTRRIRVHYYDFLSAAEADGPRGGGYEADLPHFGEFHVGMATQHGYYFALGDYLHPDRKEWRAMPTDPKGPATMTLDKMRARIAATRQTGSRAMVYLHFNLFDEGTPLYEKLKDSIEVNAEGKPTPFGWVGPDVIKTTWKMSVASPAWREHLVQQARWVMELLAPDGIVLDETFAGWGYDHHPDRAGPLWPHGIALMRKLREVVRSAGPEKALFASDCSMGNYVLWADGEAGDHAYGRLLGHPLYRQRPVRYQAALGPKPWRPCAWCFQEQWPSQMDLARATGAGVGVSNGWNEYTGLTRLPPEVKSRMIGDIESLVGDG